MKYSKQKGMVVLPELLTRQVGTWSESLRFDAKVTRYGVDWYRVKDGMGGRGDREDWCADIEGLTVSIHDYHWNGDSFGPNYKTFNNACLQQLKLKMGHTESAIAELEENLKSKRAALKILQKAVREGKMT